MNHNQALTIQSRRAFLQRSLTIGAGLSLTSTVMPALAQNQFLTSMALGDFKLFYEDHGSGPPVFFAHGAAGTHASWWQQVPVISQYYRCITYDQRGHGYSRDIDMGPYRTAFVEDLRALMDHLGIAKASLVAQSMGGRSCLGFASKYPDRVDALIMGDTTGGYVDAEITRLRARNTMARAAFAPEFAQNHPELAFMYREISSMTFPGPRNETARTPVPDLQPIISAEIPVLFIVGEKDALVRPEVIEAMHKKMPGSEFVVVPGSGHSVYFEKAEIFNQLVLDFLNKNVDLTF
ncbi:MAG: alpha/beta hydrolase [Gammaproteobacteria bacterium]|nr:alpha/beta hydrolase [Gammaproteobacteria bacterium]